MKVNYLNGMNTSASALSAQRRWMDTVAQNLANAQTTRTPEGGPYRRQQVQFESIRPRETQQAKLAGGMPSPVRTNPAHMGEPTQGAPARVEDAPQVRARVSTDMVTPLQQVYDPAHPDAAEDGYVEYPNVNPVTEMVNLILASRAYEANVAALAAEKRIQEMALEIGRS